MLLGPRSGPRGTTGRGAGARGWGGAAAETPFASEATVCPHLEELAAARLAHVFGSWGCGTAGGGIGEGVGGLAAASGEADGEGEGSTANASGAGGAGGEGATIGLGLGEGRARGAGSGVGFRTSGAGAMVSGPGGGGVGSLDSRIITGSGVSSLGGSACKSWS